MSAKNTHYPLHQMNPLSIDRYNAKIAEEAAWAAVKAITIDTPMGERRRLIDAADAATELARKHNPCNREGY